MRNAILALLAKEPAHGYELRRRLIDTLGPAGGAMNPGQVYVTLGRLEGAGLVQAQEVEQAGHPSKKVYEVTAAGRERVDSWLTDLSWSKLAPVEFHLKLVAAGATRLADPVAIVDSQRLELLRQLRAVQELALEEPADGDAALLLEGTALRLQADIRWLESCERHWMERESR
jgi:DNA-binding PadR family transcriptional regulator